MRTELTEKIIAWAKGVFNMNPESTEAELHEQIVNANDDLRTELIVNTSSQIAGFAIDEIKKQSDVFAEQLKTESADIIEQLNAKITILESKLAENDNVISNDDFQKSIDDVRKEFADQLLEVKASFGGNAAGDGRVIERADEGRGKKEMPPQTSKWRM